MLGNEPNYAVKDYARWKQSVRNIASVLSARKLYHRLTLMGADHSNGNEWHLNAVKELSDIIGAYDFHRYATPEEVRSGKLEDYIHSQLGCC